MRADRKVDNISGERQNMNSATHSCGGRSTEQTTRALLAQLRFSSQSIDVVLAASISLGGNVKQASKYLKTTYARRRVAPFGAIWRDIIKHSWHHHL